MSSESSTFLDDCEESPYQNCHGQILSNEVPMYQFATVADLLTQSVVEDCADTLISSVIDDLSSYFDEIVNDEGYDPEGSISPMDFETFSDAVYERYEEFVEDFEEECIVSNLYDSITFGMSLVFGDMMSAGE